LIRCIAFDAHYLTIDEDYRVVLSPQVREISDTPIIQRIEKLFPHFPHSLFAHSLLHHSIFFLVVIRVINALHEHFTIVDFRG
jgi:hypothetical protein